MDKWIDNVLEFDRKAILYLAQWGGSTYNNFWLYVTDPYTWIPLFLVFLYLIYTRYIRKEITVIMLSIATTITLSVLVTKLTKDWMMRTRPSNNYYVSRFLRLLQTPEDYSFISGHAANSMCLVTLLVFLFRKRMGNWVFLFYLWPVLFAYSRLYIGVHYPTDIMGGLLVGFSIGMVTYLITYHVFIYPIELLTDDR